MKPLQLLGITRRVTVEEGIAGCGLTGPDGKAVMSRTDPETGLALPFSVKGFDGRGTADEGRGREQS